MNHVDIWDVDGANKDKYIGRFRIMPSDSTVSIGESTITYNLEHVLATLLDDVMIGWVEIGNIGVYTANVLNYILSRQSVKKWVLGICDYTHQYLYGWQDENLLSALYSVTNAFIEDDYRWEFETKNYPWTLNLRRASTNPVTDIRHKKNINGVNKTIDPSNLTTRLYCYGFGEADNKLTIKRVNNNIPYLDSPNISKYGVITKVWTDERFTNDVSLLQSGQAMLASLENPIVSYNVDIATVNKAADLEAGDMVRVIDEDDDIFTRVVEVSKDDVSGQPMVGTVVLANKSTDIAQSVADMADRHRIATTYSQGAESLFADSLYDNADATNPAELSFIVPENAVHVNEILFTCRTVAFRAFSKATRGGGATTQTSTSGGASVQASQSGGGSTEATSSGGGSYTSTDNGGNSNPTSSGGGGATPTTQNSGGDSITSESVVLQATQIQTMDYYSPANHNHGIPEGSFMARNVNVQHITLPAEAGGASFYGITNYETVNFVGSGAHNHGAHGHNFTAPVHAHRVDIPEHQHNVNIPGHNHSVSIPNHQHNVSIPSHQHNVSIPNHTHNMTLPDHIHDIEYGIYKGSSANSFTVAIDDVIIGTYGYSVSNINLIAYMSKNANGEVMRGRHVIKITPNSLTRIECAIQIRLFTNARGGGQY